MAGDGKGSVFYGLASASKVLKAKRDGAVVWCVFAVVARVITFWGSVSRVDGYDCVLIVQMFNWRRVLVWKWK